MAENDLQKLGKELMAAGMLAPRDHALFGVTADVNNDNNSSVDIV